MRRAQDRARSATIKSRALGALKLASEAGRFLLFTLGELGIYQIDCT